MANNQYVNKVEYGDQTIIDITDTTAETDDVIAGEVFYAKSGARSVGTLGDATQSTHGLMSANDKTKLDNLASLADKKADVIISNASGAVAAISDGADNMPLESCVVTMMPVQSGSGDPSSSNVRSITGWSGATVKRFGANLLKNKTATRSTTSIYIGQDSTNEFPVHFIEGVTYSLSFSHNGQGTPFAYYNTSIAQTTAVQLFIGTQGTFTADKTQDVRIYVYNPNGLTVVTDFILNVGATPLPYEPYAEETTYSVTFPNEAGTVYGGTFDIISGKLVVEWELASARWGDIRTGSPNATTGLYSAQLPTVNSPVKCTTGSDYGVKAYCNIMNKILWEGNNVTPEHFYFPGPDYNRATIVGNWDVDQIIQIAFRIQTPITYQLTPAEIRTLLGYNNIYADAGNVDVVYRADTNLYIQKHTVADVQVNGISVLSQGVANVPIATWNTYGVGKADGANYGVGQASGFLVISPADDAALKAGTHQRKPVTASNEHVATFYGLAKAAGDSTQAASSNAVGIYTNSAKEAIHQMLNIPTIDDMSGYGDYTKTWSANELQWMFEELLFHLNYLLDWFEIEPIETIPGYKLDLTTGEQVADSEYVLKKFNISQVPFVELWVEDGVFCCQFQNSSVVSASNRSEGKIIQDGWIEYFIRSNSTTHLIVSHKNNTTLTVRRYEHCALAKWDCAKDADTQAIITEWEASNV